MICKYCGCGKSRRWVGHDKKHIHTICTDCGAVIKTIAAPKKQQAVSCH